MVHYLGFNEKLKLTILAVLTLKLFYSLLFGDTELPENRLLFFFHIILLFNVFFSFIFIISS